MIPCGVLNADCHGALLWLQHLQRVRSICSLLAHALKPDLLLDWIGSASTDYSYANAFLAAAYELPWVYARALRAVQRKHGDVRGQSALLALA